MKVICSGLLAMIACAASAGTQTDCVKVTFDTDTIGDYDDWPRERIAAVIDDLMAAPPLDRQSK